MCKWNWRSLQWFAATILLVCSGETLAQLRHFELHVGEVRTVSVGEVDRVAVGNEDVLSVSVLDTGELLLIPKDAGETDLHLWKPGQRIEQYRVYVQGGNVQRRLGAVRSVLSSYPGLTIREVDGLLVVEGALDPQLMDTYTAVIGALPGVISMVRPTEVQMRKLIRIKAQLIELDEQYRRRVGIRWADAAEGPTIAAVGTLVSNDVYRVVPSGGQVNWGELLDVVPPSNRSLHPFVGFSSALFSTIQLMETTGGARTLAEPVLTTRSGEEARFLSGGEFPYQTVDGNGNPVVNFREYGVQLGIAPTADADGNIVASIEAEVSSIDLSSSVGNVPGLLTRKADSVINVRDGETIIISGLLSTHDANAQYSVPGIGRLPVVGGLFRAREKTETRRELVILVTPEIITAPEQMPTTFAAQYDDLKAVRERPASAIGLLE
ncbi:pilus assembly protein N-terminal domain-containing protein [Halopseudomonas nanhaiensis]|uniref:type II and III secretion system protein family protein n=1 Tax=Halopseudomonas nanhaiensis TaxID=2830842 RepID=UPI001CBAC17B|nr:pilus assembly protein N-terminal domain-containing protein [Halopseudomonas nanhaiensis]UAW99504.1 pilus assembly protein N-terminal domain-containing protein [Halopseudomonas nanhaiensis]